MLFDLQDFRPAGFLSTNLSTDQVKRWPPPNIVLVRHGSQLRIGAGECNNYPGNILPTSFVTPPRNSPDTAGSNNPAPEPKIDGRMGNRHPPTICCTRPEAEVVGSTRPLGIAGAASGGA
jgi:hypothetical protein